MILSRKIGRIHCEKGTHFNELNLDYFPSSTLVEFVGQDKFKTLREIAKQIVLAMKKDLRLTMSSVQTMEEDCVKTKIVEEFIRGLLDIFKLYSRFTRTNTSTTIITMTSKQVKCFYTNSSTNFV